MVLKPVLEVMYLARYRASRGKRTHRSSIMFHIQSKQHGRVRWFSFTHNTFFSGPVGNERLSDGVLRHIFDHINETMLPIVIRNTMQEEKTILPILGQSEGILHE